jgi:tetratricopeptide (TPR) repeat protein
MFNDPLVRNMAFAALALVVTFLVLVLGVLLSGVATRTGPRTLAENQLSVTGAAVRSGKADSATWGSYIAALIDAGRYTQADGVIRDAKASVSDSTTADFAVAEVRLRHAQKDFKRSITVADAGQKQLSKVYKDRIDQGGQGALTAKLDGLHENWFILALLKADSYEGLGDWEKVIAELDSYLKEYPRASDILIDRGNAKIQMKDIVGAEKDFREALRFVPDDKEALDGLKKIGASAK